MTILFAGGPNFRLGGGGLHLLLQLGERCADAIAQRVLPRPLQEASGRLYLDFSATQFRNCMLCPVLLLSAGHPWHVEWLGPGVSHLLLAKSAAVRCMLCAHFLLVNKMKKS